MGELELLKKLFDYFGVPVGLFVFAAITVWKIGRYLGPLGHRLADRHVAFLDTTAQIQNETSQSVKETSHHIGEMSHAMKSMSRQIEVISQREGQRREQEKHPH
jgi:hypothetical protein